MLILDRWSAHKSKIVKECAERHSDSVHVEWLPTYAPDLNPVEQVWKRTKHVDLANLAPNDVEELDSLVVSSSDKTRGQSRLIRSFLRVAPFRQ